MKRILLVAGSLAIVLLVCLGAASISYTTYLYNINVATNTTTKTVTLNGFDVETALAARSVLNQPAVNISASDIDLVSTNRVFGKSLGADTTFTFSNLANGQRWMVILTNGASWTATWPTVTWMSGSAPVMDTGAGVVNTFVFQRQGGVTFGDVSQKSNANLDAWALLATSAKQDAITFTGDTNDVYRGNGTFSTGVTTVSTNEWQNKTFKASGTGNVLGQTNALQIGQAWRMLDGTGCTLANSNNAAAVHFMQPLFSGTGASNANYARFSIQVPDDIDTTVDLTAKITVELGGADTADQTYHLGMVSVAAGSAAAGTAANFVAATITGDAGGADGDIESTATFTLTDWKSNVTAGQYWVIELRRNGAVDASTVASYLKLLTISYDSIQ